MTLQSATRTHAVQFFEDERVLHDDVVTFFTEPIRRGHHLVMICERHTFDAVLDRLRKADEAALVQAAGRIVYVDVDEAISGFMVGRYVDAVRVEQGFEKLIGQVRRGDNKPIWLYGEMAATLCGQGNYVAAEQLEELWNVHFPEPEFKVLCGYPVDLFDSEAHAEAFRTICSLHTHVTPAPATEGGVQ